MRRSKCSARHFTLRSAFHCEMPQVSASASDLRGNPLKSSVFGRLRSARAQRVNGSPIAVSVSSKEEK